MHVFKFNWWIVHRECLIYFDSMRTRTSFVRETERAREWWECWCVAIVSTVESDWLTLKSNCWLFFFLPMYLSVCQCIFAPERHSQHYTIKEHCNLAFQFSTNKCKFVECHIVDSSMATSPCKAHWTHLTLNGTKFVQRQEKRNHTAYNEWFLKHNISKS